ncbi:MAG: O-antigen ligase [Pseudomonadota bacterium]
MQTAFVEPRYYIAAGISITLVQIDFVLATVFFAVVASPFQYDELLLYPMALYFAYALVRDRYMTWPIVQRVWPTLLFPLWWILSSTWAPDPMIAFRTGVMAMLSMFICIFLATRLTSRQLLLVATIAMFSIAVRSLPQVQEAISGGRHARGIFAHKNQFGAAMSVLALLLLGTACSRRLPGLVRLGALGLLPFSLFLLWAAQSATSTLTTIGLFGLVLGGLIFVGQRQLLTPLRMVFIFAALAAGCVVAAVAVNVLSENPIDMVLGAFGKDRSLTGRTGLWEVALYEIGERPVLGTGAYGYWLYFENASIRQLFDDYHLEWSSSFQFHNSWLNIGVEFGLVGLGLAAIGFVYCLVALVYRALARGEGEDWALLAAIATVFLRTLVESELYQPFVLLNVMMFIGAFIPLEREARTVLPAAERVQERRPATPRLDRQRPALGRATLAVAGPSVPKVAD